MKIDSVTSTQYNFKSGYHTSSIQKPIVRTENTSADTLSFVYPPIFFTGKKIADIDEGKNKLLRRLDEILKENLPVEEINETELKYKGLKVLMSLKKQLISLYDESQIVNENKTLNPQQKYNQIMQIKKEIKSIKNIYDRGFFYIVRNNNYIADEKTDYVLINKFKSSIAADNFNLKKVFTDYYQPLKNLHSIKELKEKYPKIQIPSRPENVIACKLENTITRDFYEDLDDAFAANDKKKAKELLSAKVLQLLNDNIKIKSQEEKDEAYKKLIAPILKVITARYYKLHNTGSFSSVPEFRKQNKNVLSDNDIKLLGINYDDFVLTVLKEQYTGFKNPNEIVYSKDGKNIKVSTLKESDYKFDKISTRVLKLVQDSEKVRSSQRDYKNYSKEHFKKKLEFYSEKFDKSEKVLNTLVQFDSCLFGDEDVKMLIKFLQAADKVWDGEKTLKELEDYVYYNSIKPTHTERMNAIEQKKRLDCIRAENKSIAALRNIQENYDSYINILYANNLNYLAGVCSKYKPQKLDAEQIKISKIITEVLDKNIHAGKLKNKEKVETQLMRISSYLAYTSSGTNDIIFNHARRYATDKNGEIDIEKFGKYVLNAEFMENYPQSLEIASNKQIAEKIAQNSDTQKAIEYLCKYDDYRDLSQNEKRKISNILNIFDIKDSTEKFIVKTIVEEDYLNTDTSTIAKVTQDGSKKAKTTMGKNAKNQIYDHYKFPRCLAYFDAFEDALQYFAVNKNSAGIKKVIGTKETSELKIKGHDDRLFAYNDSYYFDEFSLSGLH